jgi:pilus assembly protein CpaF
MLGQKRNASMFTPAEPQSPVPEYTEPIPENIAAPVFELKEEAFISEDAPPVVTNPVTTGRAHSLFFTPEDDSREFSEVCREVQGYIASNYSALMTGGGADSREQIRRYAAKYIQDKRIAVKGMNPDELVDAIYSEMAEYGFLTKYIFGHGIEEIDINSWRDIEVQYSSGLTEKLKEHFDSPEHAINVVRRMLHASGVILDNASPAVIGTLKIGRASCRERVFRAV